MDIFTREKGVYAFGPFRLDPVRLALLRDGERVKLGARLFDTLLYLVANHDRPVGRDELQNAVWRGRTVDDTSLAKAISELRKILQAGGSGETYIVTAAGRGYEFGVPVVFEPQEPPPPPSPPLILRSLDIDDVQAPAPAAPRRLRVAAFWAAAAAACVLAVGTWIFRAPAPGAPPLSIVVLPFRSMGPDREHAYYADQITDELDADLKSIPRSVVIDRRSAEALPQRSAVEIGRALKVRYLVEGSVFADRDGVRVNVEVADALTGRVLGLEPRAFTMPAAPQDAVAELARRIANTLGVRLVEAEVARAAAERPNTASALDQFLRARSIIDRSHELADLQTAQRLLEFSSRAEPEAVETLTTLAWLLIYKTTHFSYQDFALDRGEARAIVARALERAPRNAAALAAQGSLLVFENRKPEALAAFRNALAADPHNLAALDGMACLAAVSGLPETAIPALREGLRIDPLGPAAKGRHFSLGLALLFSGRAGEAADEFMMADEPAADHPAVVDSLTPVEEPRLFLIAATMLAGDVAEARRRYREYSAVWRHRTVWRLKAYFGKQQRSMPGFDAVFEALRAAGMPQTASDEAAGDDMPPSSAELAGRDFAQTPKTVPGAETIDTARLRQLLASRPAPVVLDVGRGVAVPPGAIIVGEAPGYFTGPAMTEAALDTLLRTGALAERARSGIIVMGSGSTGVFSYNLALRLGKISNANVYWYRGGEEAWATADRAAQCRKLL